MSYHEPFLFRFNKHIIQVDNFTIQIKNTIKFLTHYHTDHFQGINLNDHVYCSQITAQLLLANKKAKPIILNSPIDLNGLLITPISANHCPGSVMFLFEELQTRKIVLFTGDFKYDLNQSLCICWGILQGLIDILILDTTYIQQKQFISQQYAIIQGVNYLRQHFNHDNDKILFNSYIVGKERILLAIASALDIKFYATNKKRNQSLKIIFSDKFSDFFTEEDNNLGTIIIAKSDSQKKQYFSKYSKFNKIFMIEPTGWVKKFTTYQDKNYPQIIHIHIPYTEHCDSQELKNFVNMIKPKQIISILAKNMYHNNKIIQQLSTQSYQSASISSSINYI